MKKNWMRLGSVLVVMLGLIVSGCGGGGSGGDTVTIAGSGTLTDPYVTPLGETVDIWVMGEQSVCGDVFNPFCPDFDDDYVSTRFTAPADGRYRFSVTGVADDKDLAIKVYKSKSPGSTEIEYVADVDALGNGGSETAEADTLAGFYYYFFLQMWGGGDTVQVKVEEVVTPPLPPSNVGVTNVTTSSALLTWEDRANNESGFEIGTCTLPYYSGGLYLCGGGFTKVDEAGAGATSYQISGLNSGVKYIYAVRAFNSAGVSADLAVVFPTL